jgi:paraquat-inducible protein B
MNKSNPTLIGAFVLSAVAILVAAVLVLGSGKIFRRTYTFVLFFSSSVEGLRVGAPVRFKGVEIGSVKEIRLGLTGTTEPSVQPEHLAQIEIPVVIELDPERITQLGAVGLDLEDPRTMQLLIRSGLRGQLAIQSLLTGLLYIALDVRPDSPAHFVLPPNSQYHEIPTIPTTLQTVQAQAMSVLGKLQTVDLPAALNAIVDAARSIKQRVDSTEVEAAIRAATPALHEVGGAARSVRNLTDGLHEESGPLTQDLRSTSEKTEIAVGHADLAFKSIHTTLEPGSPLTYKLNNTLDDFSAAARAVTRLADYLEQNPSALIRGRSDAEPSR